MYERNAAFPDYSEISKYLRAYKPLQKTSLWNKTMRLVEMSIAKNLFFSSREVSLVKALSNYLQIRCEQQQGNLHSRRRRQWNSSSMHLSWPQPLKGRETVVKRQLRGWNWKSKKRWGQVRSRSHMNINLDIAVKASAWYQLLRAFMQAKWPGHLLIYPPSQCKEKELSGSHQNFV